jgi:hypothetical protein
VQREKSYSDIVTLLSTYMIVPLRQEQLTPIIPESLVHSSDLVAGFGKAQGVQSSY